MSGVLRALRHITAARIALAGTVALVAAMAWWWLAFQPLIEIADMPLSSAAACLVADSDLCSLARALCRRPHLLDLDSYHPAAFWSAFGLLSLAALRGVSRDPA
ncbi:hypothetical protein [Rhodomicrobium lacus]|uniref:hypothetical protein n=1 Tax=Rhodomicrobium lacus TaxID=2498452 RepID=UPI0026E39D61|nr:hypothetical protein [Rhodomicrobium lacus]WKW52111.1 hypothetical protein QMO75_06445 [Rhodomicrobium lacus]